jgi:hypothetical protein
MADAIKPYVAAYVHVGAMKRYILAATIATIPCARPALADSTYTRECRWEHGRHLCESEYKSPYATVTTECSFARGEPNKCETTSKRRAPAEPPHTMPPTSSPRFIVIQPRH